VTEENEAFCIQVTSDDDNTRVAVEAHIASHLPEHSIFVSLEEASAFFEHGSLGYSVTNKDDTLDGLELRCKSWKVEPLQVTKAQSSFFDDPERFPPGSAELDCALLMRTIHHEWYVQKPFYTIGNKDSGKSFHPSLPRNTNNNIPPIASQINRI
jgi:hypothetical protein